MVWQIANHEDNQVAAAVATMLCFPAKMAGRAWSRPTSLSEVPRLPRSIAFLFGVEFVLAIAMLLAGFFPQLPETVKVMFHAGRESNIPTWFSTIQLAVVGILFLCLVAHEHRRGVTARGPLLTGMLCLFLSLDEAAQIHEKVSGLIHRHVLGVSIHETQFEHTGYWMFFLAPILLIGFGVCWHLLKPYVGGQSSGSKLAIGALIFLASATGPEILLNFVSGNAKAVEQVVEEVGEMLGVTIVLWGALQMLSAHEVRLDFRL